jgi:hypothetical protein
VAGLDHDRADDGGVELEDDAQVRPLLGRLGDPGGDIGYWSPDGNLVFYYGDVELTTDNLRET